MMIFWVRQLQINVFWLHMYYNISGNIDSDFNLAIWQSRKDCQINLCHYQSIYTTSMGFLHTVMKSANLKSRQQCFLSKPPI